MHKTYDPKLRWYVIEVDHQEQAPGGAYGKRRIISKLLRREQAEKLRNHCEEHQALMNANGCKSQRTFELEVANL